MKWMGWVTVALILLVAIGLIRKRTSVPSAAQSSVTDTVGGVELPAIAPQLQNQWTPELEAEFQQRATAIIRHYTSQAQVGYGSTQGESEKRSYPKAMFDFLAGNRKKALAFLQAEDSQAKLHQHTEGIDYYYTFTLKGQIRKYFFLGDFLSSSYRQRMFEGAKNWTTQDPNGRPHPIYDNGDGSGRDWDISRRGGWVDSRNTDNLRAMREVAVYLMAEETGNESTRRLYQQKLERYVWALYHIGMGEWDSENYHGHTFAAYLNLYDFAQDRQVKQLAKAALDWMSTAAAVKYYRGGWGGPTKRDYGHGNVVYGSTAARTFSLYFGDVPLPNPEPELDTLHLITSSYRPPQAVVALARKQFNKPVELLSTKPVYENWKSGNDRKPESWETTFFGQTYQMGSVASERPIGDVAPFKLMAYNSQRGVDYFVANTGGRWVKPGKNEGDRIGQYRNLLIWLRPAADIPFFFQLPKTATVEVENGVWFYQLEKTWLALRPINLSNPTPVNIPNQKLARLYSQEQTFKATPTGDSYAGFALEVGEPETHGSFNQFKQAVKQKNQLDLNELAKGRVKMRSTNGNTLELISNQETLLPTLIRNDTAFDWSDHYALYSSPDAKIAPVTLGWKQGGHLKVEAGQLTFSHNHECVEKAASFHEVRGSPVVSR